MSSDLGHDSPLLGTHDLTVPKANDRFAELPGSIYAATSAEHVLRIDLPHGEFIDGGKSALPTADNRFATLPGSIYAKTSAEHEMSTDLGHDSPLLGTHDLTVPKANDRFAALPGSIYAKASAEHVLRIDLPHEGFVRSGKSALPKANDRFNAKPGSIYAQQGSYHRNDRRVAVKKTIGDTRGGWK